MDKVRIGIVGIGNMGSSHAERVPNMPRAELTAVCDINPEAFKNLGKQQDKVQCYTDLEEFLTKAPIDAVIVAVPHYDHPDVAIAAMRHGKHVLVEKPIAVHKAEALRLIAEGEKHPELVKALMFNQRTREGHKKIKQIIESGELGKITRINWIITNWFRSQFYYDSGDWRASWRGEGGGVLTNQCPHQLDLMQWFFGMPSKVRAFVKLGEYHDIEVEDMVTAYLEYPNGATGCFISSTGEAPGTNRLEIMADRGRLVFENGKLEFTRNEIPTAEFSRTTQEDFGAPETWNCTINYPEDRGNQHTCVIVAFINAILDGTPLVAKMEEGIRGLELGNAMMLSGLKDKTVTLPIDPQEYDEMLQGLIAKSRYVKKVSKKSGAAKMEGSF